jgi:hypothetical protein
MNRLRFLSFFATAPVIALGTLYYNHWMYMSERFGGNKTVVGVLFTLAVCASMLLSSFRT